MDSHTGGGTERRKEVYDVYHGYLNNLVETNGILRDLMGKTNLVASSGVEISLWHLWICVLSWPS